jgi:glycosyltransferase involved in cell wall biosynthesis
VRDTGLKLHGLSAQQKALDITSHIKPTFRSMTLISRLVFFKNKKKTPTKSSDRIKINDISIIVPVKDNQKGIDNYLDNFFVTNQHDTFPKEIIIVDNNSKPAIEICRRHLTSGLVKLLSCKTPGPAAARNFGALNSSGQWILFNDSDCIPTKSFLTGYVNADNGSIAYAGNIHSLGKDRLSKYYESQEILIPLKTYNEQGDFVPQYLITANTLVWRQAFMEVNGFNEKIKIAGGEDVDFGLRLSQIGTLSYAFDSILLHDFNDGLIGFYKRFKRYGQGNRIVEALWQTDMRPRLFRPNKRTIINEVFAKLQHLFLLHGYLQADRQIRLVT